MVDLDDFDDDDVLYKFREQRMQELKQRAKDTTEYGTGDYGIIGHEQELLGLASTVPRLVIHFFNPAFKRCTHMTEHLVTLARKYRRCRFVGIEASNSPFMAMKMGIRALPALVTIVDGNATDVLVGFDGLPGDGSAIATADLENWLQKTQVFN